MRSRGSAHALLRRGAAALAGAALLCAPLCAAARDVQVMRIDGTRVEGGLTQLAPDVIVATADGPQSIAWQDVLAISPLAAGVAPSAASQSAPPLRFLLADGSEFAGRVAATGDQSFDVSVRGDQAGRVELRAVQAIWSSFASGPARQKLDAALARKRSAEEGPSADDAHDYVIVAAKPDEPLELSGAVKRVETDKLVVLWKERERELPWAAVAGVVFAGGAARSATCRVALDDGEIFAGRVMGGDADSVRLQSSVFEGLTLPWERIERIDCRSDRLLFLSDARARRYEFEPFFDKRWEYVRDASLTGRPILLGGQRYGKGISMHSRSSLTFDVAGGFSRFVALVGVLDEMSPRGCADVRVIGDDQVLWEARALRGGEAPREVSVPLRGVQSLTLVVDYGADLDLSDQVCWALARLVK